MPGEKLYNCINGIISFVKDPKTKGTKGSDQVKPLFGIRLI